MDEHKKAALQLTMQQIDMLIVACELAYNHQPSEGWKKAYQDLHTMLDAARARLEKSL